MVAAVAGEDSAPDNALAVIELFDAARVNDAEGTGRQRVLETPAEVKIRVAAPAPTARAEAKATTRVPTELLDNLVRMVGELTANRRTHQELKSTAGHARQLVEQDRSIRSACSSSSTRGHPRRRRATSSMWSTQTLTSTRWNSSVQRSNR
jgi:chemotaxis protein histidine kinase CheA